MNRKTLSAGAAMLALTIMLAGCNPAPLPGPLVYGKCGKDAHTESYPFAKQDRRAYGCKRNADGFLETSAQGDQRRN